MTNLHHPLLSRIPLWSGYVEPGFQVSFLGVRTRIDYFPAHWSNLQESGHVLTSYPPFGEEYFEWIDLLSAVVEAVDRFTMIELGAGWGRWLVNAAVALRSLGRDIPVHLVGVEAEPMHFQWMRTHFRDNGLDPDEHRLIEAAVHAHDGSVPFVVGNSDRWYGQSVLADDAAVPEQDGSNPQHPIRKASINAVSLSTLLEPHARVDLVDLDVQGSELQVLESAIAALDRKVRRVHVGTHGAKIEAGLRNLFAAHRWTSTADYGCGTTAATPWGPIAFQDGVQSWANPRCA